MFVGFIAVVAILLIIVGLMSIGATSGSGGVDQTKATKAISEISALAQSTAFYKVTVDSTDYNGLTVQKLVDSGIIAAVDTADITADDYTIEDRKGGDGSNLSILDGEKIVLSKAVPGVVYKIVSDKFTVDNTSTDEGSGSGVVNSNNYFDISVAVKKDLTDGLKQALDTTYSKIESDINADGVKQTNDDFLDANTTDGAEVIVFN